MFDSQTSVVLLQSDRFQGLVWKTVLQSQGVAVIWESPDTDLKSMLAQMADAQLMLPHLLIVDVQCLSDMPFAFCRWCNKHYPAIQVVLTDHRRTEISDPERDWAIAQGAADFVLGFQKNNFVGSAILCVRRIFEVLDDAPMDSGELMSVVLELEREHLSLPKENQTVSNGSHNGSNGHQQAAQPVLTWRGRPFRPSTTLNSAPPSNGTPQPSSDSTQPNNSKPQRRYRGQAY
ncbi:MAG: hypothetical protein VKL39_14115 [Leptolyngbyaceae bacterium]|nr:hypothetical protein [Leptolyngbyaceae bacterium]